MSRSVCKWIPVGESDSTISIIVLRRWSLGTEAHVAFSGVLFVCFTVDHKLLFTEYSAQDVEDGLFFYTTFYNAPQVIRVRRQTL